jgi:hypothetical protein
VGGVGEPDAEGDYSVDARRLEEAGEPQHGQRPLLRHNRLHGDGEQRVLRQDDLFGNQFEESFLS